MEIIFKSKKYERVSTDITSHCNARCVFCYNLFEKTENMSREIFNKLLQIIPLTIDSRYLFSCNFEPTLNPDFIHFLQLLPVQFKNNIMFTTNLIKYISDDDIHKLAKTNVNYINISLETFNLKLYKKLVSVNETYFYDNLDRIFKIFKQYPNAPKLRFLTMILKQNYKELISIAKSAHQKYAPDLHEFRTPYGHDSTLEKLKVMLLTDKQLSSFISKMNGLNYNNIVIDPRMNIEKYKEIIKHRKMRLQKPLKIPPINSMPTLLTPNHEFYGIRINADGTGLFTATKEKFYLNDIENPSLFFSQKLFELQEKEIDLFTYKDNYSSSNMIYDKNVKFAIDEFIVFDHKTIFIRGWIHKTFQNKVLTKYVILSTNDNCENKNIVFHVRTVKRPDVAQYFNDNYAEESGFECLFSLEKARSLSSSGMVKVILGLENNEKIFYNNANTINCYEI